MTMTAAAVEFREVMWGGFAPGATDPAGGERAGRHAGTHLTLRATAIIDDVQAFVRDPDHTGRLGGTVTFTPLGAEQAPVEGVFRLFVPSHDPGTKLMVYQARFRAGDAEYCLAGAKHVRRRFALHAWADTTTLYCRLHEGADIGGRVLAAGVLRLRPLAFVRQLASFRTPNARGVSGSVRALAGFLSFFSGELIDTYVSRRRVP